jgi:hypothetical protein
MDLLTLLIILVLIGGIGSGPWWGYHQYGYGPSGIFGVVFFVLIIMFLMGRRF